MQDLIDVFRAACRQAAPGSGHTRAICTTAQRQAVHGGQLTGRRIQHAAPWTRGAEYLVGDRVAHAQGHVVCHTAHIAGTEHAPHTGACWETVWERIEHD